MNDNTTILLAQIIAGVASVVGIWFVNHAQNKRDEAKRIDDEKAAEQQESTERAKLRIELEANAQKFINDTFDDMKIRIAQMEDEQERQAAKHERQLTKQAADYERKIESLRVSMIELQRTVDKQGITIDKQAVRIESLEKENGTLREENHKLKSGGRRV